MQNDELHNWYKDSFEGIQSKPVPDIWNSIAGEIPNAKDNWQPKLIYLLFPLVVVACLALIGIGKSIDYSPRNNAFIASNLIHFETENEDPIKESLTRVQNTYRPGFILPKKELSITSNNRTNDLSRKSTEIVSALGSIESQDLLMLKNRISYASKLKPDRFFVKASLKIDAPLNDIETKTINYQNYAALSINLCNVTMINNAFRKATDKESLSANALFIKPTYSLLIGHRIKEKMFLELSLSNLNLGQSISAYNEGRFATTSKELNYLSLGLGILKYNPSTRAISTYYGGNISGRYLLKSNGFDVQNISAQDFAVGLKLGGQYDLSGLLSFSVGFSGSCSITNLSSHESSSGNKFQSSRNLAAGVEFRVARSF